jgi:hypothetical protein
LEDHNTFDRFSPAILCRLVTILKVGASGRQQHLVSEEAEIIALHLFELLFVAARKRV